MSDDQCDEAGGCGCDHGQEANVWQTRSLVAAGILTSGALVAVGTPATVRSAGIGHTALALASYEEARGSVSVGAESGTREGAPARHAGRPSLGLVGARPCAPTVSGRALAIEAQNLGEPNRAIAPRGATSAV